MLHSTWLDDKYINQLSFRLERFKRVDQYTYNFRCPICGDSKKNKSKTRGYVYPSKDNNALLYKCHNCGISMSAKNFIRYLDEETFKQYNLEALKENHKPIQNIYESKIEKMPIQRKDRFEPLKKLKKISQLKSTNAVKKYVVQRQIPTQYHHELYYVTRFMEWINKILPEKFTREQLSMDEPRLVIPFIDENGVVFGVTGRSFKKNSLRYITIMFDEEHSKVYGLNHINKIDTVYFTEGPLDSLFLSNAAAFAGSDGTLDHLSIKDRVIILDNEPRNPEIVKKLEKLISSGEKICIWPDNLKEKDINDMILSGRTKEEIEKIINNNTFAGLQAKIRLSQWRKV